MNPFSYPKSVIKRSQVPEYSNYRSYKTFLQKDFERKCVYCRKPDTWTQKSEEFGVDHYRPHSLFPKLKNTYSNLFYCCNICNRAKSDYWPSEAREKLDFIPNPCDHIMFQHLYFKGPKVCHKTPAGKFAIECLDLDSEDILEYRSLIISTIETALGQGKRLLILAENIRKKHKAKRISLDEANRALLKINEKLIQANRNLCRYGGMNDEYATFELQDL